MMKGGKARVIAMDNPAVILLVEDNPIFALSVAMELEGAGFLVVGPVVQVAQALRIIEEIAVDAALLDVDLGKELSFPVAKVLLAKGVPVAFVTGHPMAEIHQLFPDAVVVEKPVHEEILIDVARQLLAMRDFRPVP